MLLSCLTLASLGTRRIRRGWLVRHAIPARAVCAALPAPEVLCWHLSAASRMALRPVLATRCSFLAWRAVEWTNGVAVAGSRSRPLRYPVRRADVRSMYTARRVQNQAIKQSSNKSTNPPRPSSFDIMPCNDAAPPPALARRPLPLEGQKARRSKFLSLGACTPCPQRKLPNLNGDKKEAAHQGCSHSGRPRS